MGVQWETPENDLGYVRPWLYKKQTAAIFNDARYSVIEASTKSGKTIGCIVWLVEKAILEGCRGRHYWWVAPVSDQADIAFRRIKDGLDLADYTYNETRKTITLYNGAMIWFKSGDKPDSLYGEDVYAAVVDEASRVKTESWYALRSTLTATRGPIRIIGNVKGRNNWMYRMARLAQSGREDMHYAKITAYDAAHAGVIKLAEIEDAKVIYPINVFRELFLAEAGDDEGNPFGITHIDACARLGMMKEGEPYVWGWDVAKHTNFTVGIALDYEGDVVRFERFQDSWDSTVQRITNHTNGLPALVDSTGSGDQVVERLKLDGGINFEGFTFSVQSKQALMVGLALMIQGREITYPEGKIVDELKAFEYENRGDKILYRAPKGMHDDCVDSLALSARLWKRQQIQGGDAAPINIVQASGWRC
jgi:phage FluMu gp28-like protein